MWRIYGDVILGSNPCRVGVSCNCARERQARHLENRIETQAKKTNYRKLVTKMLTKLEVAWRIQAYANKHNIEFSMSERSTKRWFVYGFDVDACSSLPNGCMETTWLFIQPPDTIYRSWHWSTCGEVRAPMVKERNFADYICRMFDKYGSLCNCSADKDSFIVDNENTVWEMG